MTVHIEQVESVLLRAVQEVLSRGLNDPRVRGLISVTKVRLSEDLANATVMVSVMPAADGPLTLHGLQHATAYIRTQVGRKVRLRRMPHMRFKLDESLKRQAEVIAAINEARERDEQLAQRRNEPVEDSES